MESMKNIDDIILLFYPSNNAEHANHGGELYLKEIVIEVWGDLACFTMPYAKGERLTYPFPTPSAARGILSAIYSKPKEFRWQINRIEVLNPIRYISFKRNEVKYTVGTRSRFLPRTSVHSVKPRRCRTCAIVLRHLLFLGRPLQGVKNNCYARAASADLRKSERSNRRFFHE